MSKRSKDISQLVFRRNIPRKLQTYLINYEMLQVLAEMDGKKTVAVIAGNLNRLVKDLKAVLVALYQQKLILIVNGIPAVQHQSIEKPGIQDSIPRKKDSNRLQSSHPVRISAGTDPIDVYPPHNGDRRGKNNNRPPSRPSDHVHSSNSTGADTGDVLRKNTRLQSMTGKVKKSAVDVFSINRPQLANARKTIGNVLPLEKQQKIVPGNDGVQLHTGDKLANRSGIIAIQHFERGLAFLQQREYRKALHQFERSLAINPQNRLCRANIQRIRKLLKEKNQGKTVSQ